MNIIENSHCPYNIGDLVVVTKGDLKGFKYKIVEIDVDGYCLHSTEFQQFMGAHYKYLRKYTPRESRRRFKWMKQRILTLNPLPF